MRKKEMCWANLVSCERVEKITNKSDKHRTDYYRDYDRIIFSSAFRRLGNGVKSIFDPCW